MIAIGNIRQAKAQDFDEIWAVVRSMSSAPEGNMIQVTELAPSWELFREYRNLVHENRWNREMFETFYRPRFTREFMENPTSRRKMEELVRLDGEGKRIALVCYCQDEAMCHRSILREFLEGEGVAVTSLKEDGPKQEVLF